MGINMHHLNEMMEKRLFSPACRILDLGSSNLYCAEAQEIQQFILNYNPRADRHEVDRVANKLAAGSAYIPNKGGTNEAFVGELFEAAGMEYLSFDIAPGYKTMVLDLNRESLPRRYQRHFDLVLNVGTTEHVFNQLNCFKLVHEATRQGGFMCHLLPASGHLNHCYFTYTGRFFFDLARFNEYDLLDFAFTEPDSSTSSILESVESYAIHLPALQQYLARQVRRASASALNSLALADVGIMAVFKKRHDNQFIGAVETSTSAGGAQDTVLAAYTPPIRVGEASGRLLLAELLKRCWTRCRRLARLGSHT